MRQCFISKLYGDFFFGEGEGENCCLCLHFTDLKTPVVCPWLYLIHSFLDSVSRRMVYSDALHTARSSACRVLETCRGSTVMMLLMNRRKSVGEMTPPCGTLSRISRFCSSIHPVLLLLICRGRSI